MSLSGQTTEMGDLPGANGRRVQFGQFQFNGTDATGSLKVNMTHIDTFEPTATGTVAGDEQVTGPQIPLGGLVVDNTGTITVTRTGAAKTNGLICCYRAVGWCLLLAVCLAGLTGCAGVQKAADGAVEWLDAPASTQPTKDGKAAPTHEQVVHVVLDKGAEATSGTPAAPVFLGLSGLFGLGALVLRRLSSRDHGTLSQQIDDVAAAVKDVADAVQPPPPSATREPDGPPSH